LPDTRARLDQAERRLADMDARTAGFEARITGMERQTIELRSELNAVTRGTTRGRVPGDGVGAVGKWLACATAESLA